jgi:hypothetical protein
VLIILLERRKGCISAVFCASFTSHVGLANFLEGEKMRNWCLSLLLLLTANVFVADVFGNAEIWSGAVGRDPGLRDFTQDGTFQGSYNIPYSVKSMILVGNEVWFGADEMPGFQRITLAGQLLPSIATSWSPTSAVVVGDEVWYGSKGLIGIGRVKIDGTPLSYISSYPYESSTLCVVPEPSTLLLLGLGGIALRRNRNKVVSHEF